MSMEYRGWITVPGLTVEREADHDRLSRTLAREYGAYGPIMSWTDDGRSAQIVLATDAPDEAAAAAAMTNVVAAALRMSNLGHLYPAGSEVVAVDEGVVATAFMK
jgi:hypothetical protein